MSKLVSNKPCIDVGALKSITIRWETKRISTIALLSKLISREPCVYACALKSVAVGRKYISTVGLSQELIPRVTVGGKAERTPWVGQLPELVTAELVAAELVTAELVTTKLIRVGVLTLHTEAILRGQV